jgi:hypothetical protein
MEMGRDEFLCCVYGCQITFASLSLSEDFSMNQR